MGSKILLAPLALLSFVPPLAAQGPAFAGEATPLTLEFNFSNPGARSLAMGGAFAGLADDASAAYANPAGLVILSRPEISLEGREWRHETEFVERGRLSGSTTGIGQDRFDGVQLVDSSSHFDDVSFLSLAYPSRRWALALYRHRVAGFADQSVTQGLFLDVAGAPARLSGRRLTTDLDVSGSGLAAGFSILPGRFSMGVTLVSYDIRLSSLAEAFVDSGAFFDEQDLQPQEVATSVRQSLSEDEISLNLGILWRSADRWSIGAFARFGATASFTEEQTVGPFLARLSPTLREGDVLARTEGRFGIPDVLGIGGSVRVTEGLVLLGEWDRVQYSDVYGGRRISEGVFEIDDAHEWRLGMEYTWWSSRLVPAVRVGVWLEPEHRVRFESDLETSRARLFRALYLPGRDVAHYSAGFGLAIQHRLQLDAALDVSGRSSTVSLSGVLRF